MDDEGSPGEFDVEIVWPDEEAPPSAALQRSWMLGAEANAETLAQRAALLARQCQPQRMRFPARLPTYRYWTIWRQIERAYYATPHSFLRGCGRETLTWWVAQAGERFSPCEVYACLFQALAEGRVKQRQSVAGYRIWILSSEAWAT